MLAAEEMVNGLAKYTIGGIQKKTDIDPSAFQKNEGQRGVVFFKDARLD